MLLLLELVLTLNYRRWAMWIKIKLIELNNPSTEKIVEIEKIKLYQGI